MDVFPIAQAAGQLMLQRISHKDNTQADYPPLSLFGRPEVRGECGWEIEINRSEVESAFNLLEHIRRITNSNFGDDWIGVLVRHFVEPDRTLGQTVGAMDGHYYYAMNTKDGIIIATESSSPYATQRSRAIMAGQQLNGISPNTLQTWSDLTYLSWHAQCTQSCVPVTNLKHIIRRHITNLDTLIVIEWILQKERRRQTPEGWTIDIDDPRGYGAALFGIPNGKRVGWLLAQHKRRLGNAKVVSVEIFSSVSVRFDEFDEDTGEIFGGREDVGSIGYRGRLKSLNLDFTVRCG